MADKAKKENKNLIVGICSAVIVVALIIVVAVLATRGSGLNDNYFKSDDTKYVLTVDSEMMGEDIESQEYAPTKTHIVYTYSGEEITGMKTYLEYADAATAQKAFDAMKESGEEMGDAKVDGKYIVATNEASTYEGMTTEDVKQQIQAIELLQNIKDNSNDENEDEVEETEESENE
ncbi:hypothetical protein J6X04_00015 [Candidatus Saccharibacteria bacterium]|nr:hypothetical protein [Candidatus Saccharibacteria bacterium]